MPRIEIENVPAWIHWCKLNKIALNEADASHLATFEIAYFGTFYSAKAVLKEYYQRIAYDYNAHALIDGKPDYTKFIDYDRWLASITDENPEIVVLLEDVGTEESGIRWEYIIFKMPQFKFVEVDDDHVDEGYESLVDENEKPMPVPQPFLGDYNTSDDTDI